MHHTRQAPMAEKSLDPQLWHACAGGMVQMPPLNSKVYYFPQGHAEHATGNRHVEFTTNIPSLILCRVSSIKYMADPETDEVFTKIGLVPVKTTAHELDLINTDESPSLTLAAEAKAASFAKTLTQSDANNGGGFSVPRYCAETIFPRLDYSAEPPVQTIVAKDVHGESWKFRHIYRGTPRRHLLTTGWSNFVNQKKLVAGDSIVFLRSEINGDLCMGIRRAKQGIGGGPPDHHYGSYSYGNGSWVQKSSVPDGSSASGESVVRAATLAAKGEPFEVVYYPRGSTPEFFVKASLVRSAMRTQWLSGMRFKMPFETEDSSRISWFMGTISSAQVADSIRWPNSPWRLLQVAWDEPELLQNVKRVNPWLVELVSTMPLMHLSPFSPPRKKQRVPGPANGDFPLLVPHNNPNPLCLGVQGARHAHHQYALSQLHNLGQFPHIDSYLPPPHHHFPNGKFDSADNSVSCFLTMGPSPPCNFKESINEKKSSAAAAPPHILLFGQVILADHTSRQSSCSSQSNSSIASHRTTTSSSEEEATVELPLFKKGTADLSAFASSCQEIGSEMLSLSSILYKDEPFCEFLKTAKSLTIPVGSIMK